EHSLQSTLLPTLSSFLLMLPLLPFSTLFPYTTLFRSEFLGRDVHRLRAAFATINRSPLGACAITTTGFPIRRDYTANRKTSRRRSEEHTSELQSRRDLVCRLLLEKKKNNKK